MLEGVDPVRFVSAVQRLIPLFRMPTHNFDGWYTIIIVPEFSRGKTSTSTLDHLSKIVSQTCAEWTIPCYIPDADGTSTTFSCNIDYPRAKMEQHRYGRFFSGLENNIGEASGHFPDVETLHVFYGKIRHGVINFRQPKVFPSNPMEYVFAMHLSVSPYIGGEPKVKATEEFAKRVEEYTEKEVLKRMQGDLFFLGHMTICEYTSLLFIDF